jgi:hypothetical protein
MPSRGAKRIINGTTAMEMAKAAKKFNKLFKDYRFFVNSAIGNFS